MAAILSNIRFYAFTSNDFASKQLINISFGKQKICLSLVNTYNFLGEVPTVVIVDITIAVFMDRPCLTMYTNCMYRLDADVSVQLRSIIFRACNYLAGILTEDSSSVLS